MMGAQLFFCVFAVAALRAEDTDDVIVEEVSDTVQNTKAAPEPVQQVTNDDGAAKQVPKIFRKYQNIKQINKYQILAMESSSLIKEFLDITAASTFVDVNVMLELQRKSDEISKVTNDLQGDFKNLAKVEQKRFMEEYKQLLFNTLPQRVRHFKELSGNHLTLHHQVMDCTIDALRGDETHTALLDYAHSRLRHKQFASEGKLREMIRAQQRKRNKWYFGLTRLEWVILTGQIWLAAGAFCFVSYALSAGKTASKGKSMIAFEVCLFSIIAGLVYVELNKYQIAWSFAKLRVAGISVVQFVILAMLREARRVVFAALFDSKRAIRPTVSK